MNLLARERLGLEGLLETVADEGGADVGVGDVRQPRRTPEGDRRR